MHTGTTEITNIVAPGSQKSGGVGAGVGDGALGLAASYQGDAARDSHNEQFKASTRQS